MADCSFSYSPSVNAFCTDNGAGPLTYVLVHGFGTSAETWHDIRPMLAGAGRVLAIDLKGFGRSSKPDDHRYSPADQAAIVAAFLRHHALQNVILVGHSYGAGVAVLAHESLREAGMSPVKALVLIDAALYKQDLPFFVSNLRRPLLNRLILNLTTATFRARYTLRRVFKNTAAVTDDRVERYARFLDLPGAHRSFIRAAKQIDQLDFDTVETAIQRISVPTLIVWGAGDPVIPVSTAHRLLAAITTSTLRIIPDAGHVPHEEYPSETAKAILSFVNDL